MLTRRLHRPIAPRPARGVMAGTKYHSPPDSPRRSAHRATASPGGIGCTGDCQGDLACLAAAGVRRRDRAAQPRQQKIRGQGFPRCPRRSARRSAAPCDMAVRARRLAAFHPGNHPGGQGSSATAVSRALRRRTRRARRMDGSATCTIAAPGTTSCTAARTPRITQPPAARTSVRSAAAMALLCSISDRAAGPPQARRGQATARRRPSDARHGCAPPAGEGWRGSRPPAGRDDRGARSGPAPRAGPITA